MSNGKRVNQQPYAMRKSPAGQFSSQLQSCKEVFFSKFFVWVCPYYTIPFILFTLFYSSSLSSISYSSSTAGSVCPFLLCGPHFVCPYHLFFSPPLSSITFALYRLLTVLLISFSQILNWKLMWDTYTPLPPFISSICFLLAEWLVAAPRGSTFIPSIHLIRSHPARGQPPVWILRQHCTALQLWIYSAWALIYTTYDRWGIMRDHGTAPPPASTTTQRATAWIGVYLGTNRLLRK